MRIHGQEFSRVVDAETAASRDVLMRKTEFADQPHHLLHIE